jgi:hypothetical protein
MADGFHKTFRKESYDSIKQKLLSYRLDPFIRDIESKGGPNKGNIFPFARGLRFSALLIYEMRQSLSKTDLEVSWGQIVTENGEACSGECDIIVHRKGYEKKWNGSEGTGHIMDFRFIHQNEVLAVISCKSYLTKSAIEKEYYDAISKYVKRVWLFAECCGPESVKLIADESKRIGYGRFWYMYTWSRTTGDISDSLEGWDDFIENVIALAKEK